MRRHFLLLALLTSVIACKQESEFKQISFWTDKPLTDEEYRFVFANEEPIGAFTEVLTSPSCTSDGTIAYELPIKTSVEISIRNASGEAIVIASIDVDNASSGINVNTDNRDPDTTIRFSNDGSCTLTYLSW